VGQATSVAKPAADPPERRQTGIDLWLLAGCAVLLIYWLLLYLPAGEAHIRAHDFLDSVFGYYVLRARTEAWFLDFGARVEALNGLPVSSLALGDFSLPAALFGLLPPFEALVVMLGLLRLGAFIGMYLLLRDHVLRGLGSISLIAVAVALSFAFLSHMPSRLGNIMLLPLLLWALINLWQGRRRRLSSLICVGFPLVWSMVYGGYIVAAIVGAAALAAYVCRVSTRRDLGLVFIAFCCIALVVEMRLVSTILFPAYESFRDVAVPAGWNDSLARTFVDHFLRDANGHHHVGQFPIVVAVVLATLLCLPVLWLAQRLGWLRSAGIDSERFGMATRRLAIALIATAAVSFAWASLRIMHPFLVETLNLPYRLDRIDILSPVLWRIDVALALAVLALAGPVLLRRAVYPLALLAVVLFALQHQTYELKSAVAQATGAPPFTSLFAVLRHAVSGKPYSAGEVRYYSREAYPRLKDYFRSEASADIDQAVAPLGPRDEYRVLAIGLSPTVFQFHGFHTLDGYFYHHARSYGEGFADLFAVELDRKYEDGEEPRSIDKRIYAPIAAASRTPDGLDVEFDVCRFHASGGRLVFAPEPLSSAPRLGLELLAHVNGLAPQDRLTIGFGKYEDIYLYRTTPAAVAACPPGDAGLRHP